MVKHSTHNPEIKGLNRNGGTVRQLLAPGACTIKLFTAVIIGFL